MVICMGESLSSMAANQGDGSFTRKNNMSDPTVVETNAIRTPPNVPART